MKRFIFNFIFLSLFLLIVNSFVFAIEPEEYQSLTINITLNANVEATSNTKLIANLTLSPKDYENQKIIAFETFGDSAVKGEYIIYQWDSTNKEKYGWNSIIKIEAYFPQIGKINFPITISEHPEYKKASEHIDINSDIIKTANQIVQGKTDLFGAVHAIAEYVNTNMEYDENYVQEIMKASWILENKRGVCDEYSILFIALTRAIGVPARYVSGIAYSNIKKEFGAHAWAEVYFPGYGWIPFDPTYGQFGWLDATHVALYRGIDTANSVTYSFYAGTKFIKNEIDIKANILEYGSSMKKKLSLYAKPLQREVGENSFVPLKIEVNNENNYYLPLTISLLISPGLHGKNIQYILAEPQSRGETYFILKIPSVDDRYIYRSVIKATDQFGDIAESEILFSSDYERMPLSEAQQLINELQEQKYSYLYDVLLNCTAADNYYEAEEVVIKCRIESRANVILENLNLCIEQDCRLFDLPISSAREEEFSLQNKTNVLATISNNDLTKKEYVSVKILKWPQPNIMSIEPKQIEYKDNILVANLRTESICNDLILRINNIEYSLGNVEGLNKFELHFSGKNALNEKLRVNVKCKDLRNQIHEDSETFSIQVLNIPWYAKFWQKIAMMFEK